MSKFFGAKITFEATDHADAQRILDVVADVLTQSGNYFVFVVGPEEIKDD